MGGGLLNLIAYGNKNIILNGDPEKNLFKTTYAKYTNFGMQKFRVNFDGQKSLRLNTSSVYKFSIPRYADMLSETCFTIDLPHIWSTFYVDSGLQQYDPSNSNTIAVQPYEFKWIKNLGFQMIKSVKFTIGGQQIQQYSGSYLYNMILRDYPAEKKKLLDEMTGNTSDLNDPANHSNRNGHYPTAFKPEGANWSGGIEPSIRGRKLYIPINIWTTLNSKLSFPIAALKYNLLQIEITCRPIQELFVIRDINQYINENYSQGQLIRPATKYIKPQYISTFNTIDVKYQMRLFLQQPPGSGFTQLNKWITSIDNTQLDIWYADPYLMSTYAFLDPQEVRVIVTKRQSYLFREIHESKVQSVASTFDRIRFNSTTGIVRNWMWYFQRNDVQLRNEWSNYTNWAYDEEMPYPCIEMYNVSSNPEASEYYKSPCRKPLWCGITNCSCCKDCLNIVDCSNNGLFQPPYTPLRMYDLATANFDVCGNFITEGYSYPYITGPSHRKNEKYIMKNWALILDGRVRENELNAGIPNYVDKYVRTSGNAKSGLYCYNFCLNSNTMKYQPNGAMNLAKFKHIGFEYDTILPPQDMNTAQFIICDASGQAQGINKVNWQIYKYNYDLYIMEERYNYLTFDNGQIKLELNNI